MFYMEIYEKGVQITIPRLAKRHKKDQLPLPEITGPM
jgi:hypothetical protein